jgi:hypothetical protein
LRRARYFLTFFAVSLRKRFFIFSYLCLFMALTRRRFVEMQRRPSDKRARDVCSLLPLTAHDGAPNRPTLRLLECRRVAGAASALQSGSMRGGDTVTRAQDATRLPASVVGARGLSATADLKRR